MQIGFTTAVVPEMSLAEALSLAEGHGFQAVEAQCWPRMSASGVTHIDVSDFGASSARHIRALLQRSVIALSALSCSLPSYGPDIHENVSEAHLFALIEAAHLLGVRRVALHAASVGSHFAAHKGSARLTALAAFATDRSVLVCIDDPSLYATCQDAGAQLNRWRQARMELLRAGVCINYDPAQLARNGLDELSPIAMFGDAIGLVRAIDNWASIVVGAGEDSIGAIWRAESPSRRVRWRAVLAALGAASCAGPVTIGLEPGLRSASLEVRVNALQCASVYLRGRLAEI